MHHMLLLKKDHLLLLLLLCQKTQLQFWGVELLQNKTVFCPMWEDLIIRQQEYLLPRTRELTVFPVVSRAMQAIMFIYILQRMVQKCPSCIHQKTRNLTPDRPFSYCQLSKGDKIWIQNRNARIARLHDHGSYNMFSGALLTKM